MKIKIINHRKFRRRVILILFILCCIVFNIKNSASSEAKIEYKTITVSRGDTLWTIAQREQIISDIKNINNLKSSSLSIEQNLNIPTIR